MTENQNALHRGTAQVKETVFKAHLIGRNLRRARHEGDNFRTVQNHQFFGLNLNFARFHLLVNEAFGTKPDRTGNLNDIFVAERFHQFERD